MMPLTPLQTWLFLGALALGGYATVRVLLDVMEWAEAELCRAWRRWRQRPGTEERARTRRGRVQAHMSKRSA